MSERFGAAKTISFTLATTAIGFAAIPEVIHLGGYQAVFGLRVVQGLIEVKMSRGERQEKVSIVQCACAKVCVV